MIWKIFANVLLNLGLFTLAMCIYWAFKHEHYPLAAAAVFALSLVGFLKIRLVKSVKEMQKK